MKITVGAGHTAIVKWYEDGNYQKFESLDQNWEGKGAKKKKSQ